MAEFTREQLDEIYNDLVLRGAIQRKPVTQYGNPKFTAGRPVGLDTEGYIPESLIQVGDLTDLLDGTYSPIAHTHNGSEITAGTIADARIASTIARDSEVAAAYAALASANVFSANQRVPRLEIDDAGHYVDVTSYGGFQLTTSRFAIANNGTVVLGTSSTIALLIIIDTTSGNVGVFFLRGAVNATQELLDPSSVFSAASGTANSFNVYYSSPSYLLQNTRGASRNMAVYHFVG